MQATQYTHGPQRSRRPGVPVPLAEADTPVAHQVTPGASTIRTSQPRRYDRPLSVELAEAQRLISAHQRAEAEARELELRYATSWIRRWWKRIAGIVAVVAALAGAGWRLDAWYASRAEADVAERQAKDAGRVATEANTSAIEQLTTTIETDLRPRMGAVEDLQRLQLRIQLGDQDARAEAARRLGDDAE